MGRGFGDTMFGLLLKTPLVVRLGYPLARGIRHLLLKALGKDKGSGEPNRNKIGFVTKDQVRDDLFVIPDLIRDPYRG